MDVVTRGEDRPSGLVWDRSSSSDCGMNVPFLHDSSSSKSPRLMYAIRIGKQLSG